MANKWSDLYDKIPPERRAKIEAGAEQILAELPLADLRSARQYTQVRLAEILGKAQSEISRIEHRTDAYVSTLRSYIEAMGGQLDIVATFPEGSVRVDMFREIEGMDDIVGLDEPKTSRALSIDETVHVPATTPARKRPRRAAAKRSRKS